MTEIRHDSCSNAPLKTSPYKLRSMTVEQKKVDYPAARNHFGRIVAKMHQKAHYYCFVMNEIFAVTSAGTDRMLHYCENTVIYFAPETIYRRAWTTGEAAPCKGSPPSRAGDLHSPCGYCDRIGIRHDEEAGPNDR